VYKVLEILGKSLLNYDPFHLTVTLTSGHFV